MSMNVAPSADRFPVGTNPNVFSETISALSTLIHSTPHAQSHSIVHRLWLLAFVGLAIAVRLWGLASVGLHGDEETMAMAVRGILQDGAPILPSGMFYPRGMIQLYLMAGSVSVLGETEFALRLPSVVCGAALVCLAYLAGRRFLRPNWALALAASSAVLPALVEYSQTARMYIFLITFIMAAMVCLFEWERTGRLGWLVGATASLILGLDMQVLAVAGVLMLLVPGMVRGDARKLLQGGVAALVVVLAYFLLSAWLESHYPRPAPEFAEAFAVTNEPRSRALRDFTPAVDAALGIAGAFVVVLAWRVGRAVNARAMAMLVTALFVAAVALQVALYYHLAGIVCIAALVLALRHGTVHLQRRLIALLAAMAALAIFHVALIAPNSGTFVRLVGALVGQPSVWPYVRIAQLSPLAGVATAALLAWGLYQLAHQRRVPDYWLVAVLGIWAPLFALGLFAWNVPPRYTAMSLAPMLLCAFAALQHATDWLLERKMFVRRASQWGAAAVVIVALLVANPLAAVATVTAGYRAHPDHKGAAEFIRSLGITKDDIVLAEDVLQQTYYLGRVDYWLIGPQVARRFVERFEDSVADFYTHTAVIVTPAMLDDLLQKNRDKRIFVIGSGEGWTRGRREVREDLHTPLESNRFKTLYTGRDGLTRVLQAVPTTPLPVGTPEKAEADEAALVEETTDAQRKEAQDAVFSPVPAE